MNIRILSAALMVLSSIAVSAQGDTVWNRFDENGIRQGNWKKYGPDSTLIYSGYFSDGKPVGIFTRYYENGGIKAIMDHDPDGIHSFTRLYYRNGGLAAEGHYLGRDRTGTWKFYSYYTRDLVMTEAYEEGRKQGVSQVFYPDGHIAEKKHWEKDTAAGPWLQFYEDSTIRLRANMASGKIHGDYILYNRDGVIMVRGRYACGKMDGTWTFYDNDGKQAYSLNYADGVNTDREGYYERAKAYLREIEEKTGTIPEPDVNDLPEMDRQ